MGLRGETPQLNESSPLRTSHSHIDVVVVVVLKSSLEDMLIDFRERRGERKREGEKHPLVASRPRALTLWNPQPRHVP